MDYLHEVAACKGERLLEGLREIAQEVTAVTTAGLSGVMWLSPTSGH
jgi:hypothetical protein